MKRKLNKTVIGLMILLFMFMVATISSLIGIFRNEQDALRIFLIILVFDVILILLILNPGIVNVPKPKNVVRKLNSDGSPTLSKRERIKENRKNAIACCPKCGSTSLSANKKGFGIGKAVVGASLLWNPIGLVAGNLGAKKVRVTCLNCGKQFWAGKR